ncbi:hypothetical protein [Pseudohalioglobus lutimaris]|uniref:DUF1579 domain-containing protein n=1 Tax=Pseudohalioglobus lutimaris TaxID=1737061 RepID=A0A2N5X1K8_9GAMM|nr:hypothetical protein [Pseudohalioglobus lutimaris]PLW68373.1 hypothetical protein C0039_12590 [Pseudohalioglobus lutimaris]
MRLLILCLLALPWAAHPQQEAFDCAASTPHRAFDFWLGKWTVHDVNGTLQGHNEVRAIEKGCAVREQWRSVRGGTGQSLNVYQPATGQWRQLWVDAGASIIDIHGAMMDGSMKLEGEIYYLQRKATRPLRGQWTPLPDGRVRQFFQEQDESGEWQTWFEGFYTRTGN